MNLLSRIAIIFLLVLLTSRAEAQLGGLVRRLPGPVGDAARAAEALRDANAARQIASPLAGTYRLVFAFGPPAEPTDSVVLFIRSFEKPTTGNVGGRLPTPEKAANGQMTQGYSLAVVAARSEADLPVSVDLVRGESRLGGGLLVVYPFAGDSTLTRAFSVDWVVLLPKNTSAENDSYNKRMDRLRAGGIVQADGSGKPTAANRTNLSQATTLLRTNGEVEVSYGVRKGDDLVIVRGERISADRYTSAP